MTSERLCTCLVHLLVLLTLGLSLGTVQYNTPAAKTTGISLTGSTLQEVNSSESFNTHGQYLCVEKREAPDGVKRNQNFHQKLLVLGLQRQSEAIDDADKRQTQLSLTEFWEQTILNLILLL